MQEQAANAAGVVAPARTQIDWRYTDEQALIRGMLEKADLGAGSNSFAASTHFSARGSGMRWRASIRRFVPQI